jgi:flagellar biosynthetic protein FlhB
MAETDDASKTEQPTERRIRQGRERGQVAQSQDLKTWAVLGAGVPALGFLLPPACRALGVALIRFIDYPETLTLDRDGAPQALLAVLAETGWAIAPVIGVIFLCAVGSGLVQVGFLWAPEKIAPDLSRLSPLEGLKRLFSLQSLVEFGKGLIKIGVVAAILAAAAAPILSELEEAAGLTPLGVLDRVGALCLTLTAGTAAVLTVIAAADYGYQRFSLLKQMRMSKQEILDEHKETEGDPHIKARIRRLRAERSRKRMMAAVPTADVVITNPTHYAVALAYEMETMAAPKLVAKGADHLALRIRAVAKEHAVPIVENPPLARTLYASVDIDAEIQPEHYEAVAAVIGYVMRLKGKR